LSRSYSPPASLAGAGVGLVERGLVPDRLVRAGIRRLLRERLVEIDDGDCEGGLTLTEAFIAAMDASSVALVPELANEQHYEVPASFYERVLGPRRKYSCCVWPSGGRTLADAEDAALRLTCERANIRDGQRILELGCGWGSLSLWIAEAYPAAEIVAVSNSASQRAFIEAEAGRRGWRNVRVITADMNDFTTDSHFDRVVSVEMFEHMRNWRELFRRIHAWLEPGGQFFLHVFCHRDVAYPYEDRAASDWMSRVFFSGGMMPSDDLPARFQEQLRLVARWRIDGTHYSRTLDAWLANMDRERAALLPIVSATYGSRDAARWWNRWRIFFMACSELFAYRGGQEWYVGHYRFERR
jgi:cyclopropane-fatty-acyl-phospholipid synthase